MEHERAAVEVSKQVRAPQVASRDSPPSLRRHGHGRYGSSTMPTQDHRRARIHLTSQSATFSHAQGEPEQQPSHHPEEEQGGEDDEQDRPVLFAKDSHVGKDDGPPLRSR